MSTLDVHIQLVACNTLRPMFVHINTTKGYYTRQWLQVGISNGSMSVSVPKAEFIFVFFSACTKVEPSDSSPFLTPVGIPLTASITSSSSLDSALACKLCSTTLLGATLFIKLTETRKRIVTASKFVFCWKFSEDTWASLLPRSLITQSRSFWKLTTLFLRGFRTQHVQWECWNIFILNRWKSKTWLSVGVVWWMSDCCVAIQCL